ncbi:MAG: SDR family NAD(P)-dependent oxidoreductase [Planctomycetota bacterium]|jgi:NAD(P)-dependent dehydrogenase (short-subunit alcohol dehydrogenase family)
MSAADKALALVGLEGKVAVVTGGASGIGLGTAKRLAEMGASVAIADINEATGTRAVEQIEQLGAEVRFFPCDVRSDADCERSVVGVIQAFGKIDILFNNAGVIIRKSTVDLTADEWDQALDITLRGVYLMSHHVIPHMIENGGGSIINTGSGWSLKGGPDAVAYCAAKGGVLNLTRAMAIDHGKHNIRVNCVCPGDVDTPLLRSECAQLNADVDAFMKEAADRPIGRVGTPEDVANAVLFFASDMSAWVTGAHLVVDGGGIA